jgi:hypothetical protein
VGRSRRVKTGPNAVLAYIDNARRKFYGLKPLKAAS